MRGGLEGRTAAAAAGAVGEMAPPMLETVETHKLPIQSVLVAEGEELPMALPVRVVMAGTVVSVPPNCMSLARNQSMLVCLADKAGAGAVRVAGGMVEAAEQQELARRARRESRPLLQARALAKGVPGGRGRTQRPMSADRAEKAATVVARLAW